MINGPHFTPVNRLHPIDKDRQEDQQDPNKKKKVLYHGRSWAEKEEALPVQPKKQEPPAPKKKSTVMYADRLLLEKAKKYFQELSTLEEKAAQLFFLEVESFYDTAAQREIEITLQTWQLGGILFKKGEYRRQAYLIERFQEISKIPLLLANDFLHGLSFYLQGDPLKTGLSNQHYMDLGKAVMVQNRRMGVHIQLDGERKSHILPMTDAQAKSFRKGIREASGVVGKQKSEKMADNFSHAFKNALPHLSLKESPFISPILHESIQESVGYKVVTFFDLTEREWTEDTLLSAYKDHYDVFLVSKQNSMEAIKSLCKLVKMGRISEDDLDKKIMKILIIKVLNYKEQKNG